MNKLPKNIITFLMCYFVFMTMSYAQDETSSAIVLELPARNSLMFNRYSLSPTFSYVRENNKHIIINNKRELVQVGNAPETYVASFSGRFTEKIGGGLGVFQRNFGVFSTFGGIANFAYNAQLSSESNLTFGLNLLAYSNSLNIDQVVVNSDDPILNQVSSSFLTGISPGVNYGTAFLDVGVTINNLVTYDTSNSQLFEEQSLRGIQGHLMYTGFIDSYGFFDNSKFTALGRAEIREDKNIYSAAAMLTTQKGFWIQGGIHSIYGANAGVGLNITSQIALEYNYERSLGSFSNLGSTHELTLAYIISPRRSFNYKEERITGLLNFEKTRRSATRNKRPRTPQNPPTGEPNTDTAVASSDTNPNNEPDATTAIDLSKSEADELAKLEADAKAERDRLDELERQRQAEADAKAEQDRLDELERQRQAEADAKAEQDRLDELERQRQAEADAQAERDRLAEEERQRVAALEREIEVKNPTDQLGRTIQSLTTQTTAAQSSQNELIERLKSAVADKDTDLQDLKEENDLSDRGIFVAPKPFKSISKENARIETLKTDIDASLQEQNAKIAELENLYAQRVKKDGNNDATNQYYNKAISDLKAKRDETQNLKSELIESLERIKVATEFERNRRIKRATYDDVDDTYKKDQERLEELKRNTPRSVTPLAVEDFNFGSQVAENSAQVLTNVENIDNGFYLILAVHSDTNGRDEFVKQVIASGYSQVNYFYDINTSKYYTYFSKVDSFEEATSELSFRDSAPFTSKMSIVKIDN